MPNSRVPPIETNKNGGNYFSGIAYGPLKKLEVEKVYREHAANGLTPNISAIARETSVSDYYVRKIQGEILEYGKALLSTPQNTQETGPGSKTLDDLDEFALYLLYLEAPYRSLSGYRHELESVTGAVVSDSTISRWFTKAFPIAGNLRKPNLIPKDKFKPENLARAKQYISIVLKICPRRLKFGDEKLLKGTEIFCRSVRRDVLTGEVPDILVESDFRNTYTLIGFCSIDRRAAAFSHVIHDGTNDADAFFDALLAAINSGFLSDGDFLVLDNAAIHFQGENDGLEDWLWSRCGIWVLSLPTRSPELNPIELLWRSLGIYLKQYPLYLLNSCKNAVAHAAHEYMSKIQHRAVEAVYHIAEYL
jgi:hypothetical protein